MDCAGKNGAQCDPEKYAWAPTRAGKRAEYRAKACDVQKLNEKDPRRAHRHIVRAVRHGKGRRRPVIGAQNLLRYFPISEKAYDQNHKTYKKANHSFSLLIFFLYGSIFRLSEVLGILYYT